MKRILKKYWLLFLLIGIVLYLLIGMMVPFVKLKTIDAGYSQSFQVSDFYSDKVSPDRAAVVESSMDALDERIRMISQAKEKIILSTFDIRQGESTRDILAMLQNAADRGVEVQILVDGISRILRMEGKSLFYAMSSHPNIEIKIYNTPNPLKPWTFHGRMHDKYLIVDDQFYLLGGRNTFDYFLGNYIEDDKSLDREVLIYNTAAGTPGSKQSSLNQVRDYFEEIWNLDVCSYFHEEEKLQEKDSVKEIREELSSRFDKIKKEKPELFDSQKHYQDITVPIHKATLVSNPKGIGGKEPLVWYELLQLMKNAKEKVVIHTPYAVLSEEMYEGMEEIGSRGISFSMLINSVENGDNLVASSDYLRNKGQILDTGVTLYEYDGGDSYHGKSILVDSDISVIGSYNLDMRSTYVDTELMLVVDSPELNASLAGHMETLQEDARKVIDTKTYETPDHVKVVEVPFWKRILWKVMGFVLQPFRVLV